MKVHSLYNTSDGNATRVYNNITSLLIDCGVSMRKLFANGEFKINALFVTHGHSDHSSGIGVIGRATGATIYINKKYKRINNETDIYGTSDFDDIY